MSIEKSTPYSIYEDMKQQHVTIKAGDIPPYILLVGDPKRVERIGGYMRGFQIIAKNREFVIGVGRYKDVRVAVCSTGIGSPSTAIAVEELINAGAKYLIRVGTCGGAWRSDIKKGSLIIPTACIRDEGTTKEYIPLGFPAVADTEITQALETAAKEKQAPYAMGINRTHDAYYGAQDAIIKWGSYLQDERWKNADTPILSSDMETSTLYVLASLRNVKAGAILLANAEPEPLISRIKGQKQDVVADTLTDTQPMTNMIYIALEAIRTLSEGS